MVTRVTIDYDDSFNEYIVDSSKLKDFHLKGMARTIPGAVEGFFSHLENEINSYKWHGQDEDYPDMSKLLGLQFHVYPQFLTHDEDDIRYIKALNLMLKQHIGQKDKAGQDYIFHPIRVSKRCLEIDDKIVALLHDTIEDTGMTPDGLIREGIKEVDVVDAVVAITRREDETYAQFIERVCENDIAREVKFHDLEDNMDITRLPDLKEKDFHRLNKYLHAWRYINDIEKDTSLIVD